MNKINQALSIVSLALMISCSTDEALDKQQLPDGKYPLELTAANIAVARATADGSWTDGSKVALTVSGDTTIYTYTADANGNLTSQAPYYWLSTDDITVTAWYPYDASDPWTVQPDQSGDGYQASDYIRAIADTIRFADQEKTLTFVHQVAKVTVTLTAGDGIATSDLADATISIHDGSQWIATHDGSALIAPATLSGEFIAITLYGTDYSYSLPTSTTFLAGNAYTYDIEISRDGLTLRGCKISQWNENSTVNGDANLVGALEVTAGKLTDAMIKAAIDDCDGNVTITGTLNQSDLDIIFNHRNEYVNLDMSGANVSVDNVKFGTGTPVYSGESKIKSVSLPQGLISIAENAFYYCLNLASISIPESVTAIGDFAFQICESLASITIPSKVTTIGNFAFLDCTSLTSITISEGVTTIGEYAFYDCSSLTSITIPEGVTTIGEYAFYDCSSLTSVTCEAKTPPTLGVNVFDNHSKNEFHIYVPSESVEAYKAQWSYYADYITAIKQ